MTITSASRHQFALNKLSVDGLHNYTSKVPKPPGLSMCLIILQILVAA